MPGSDTPASVEVHPDLPYSAGSVHQLDFYAPRDKTGFPVVVFIHGGSWRVGDRWQYRGLGNRLARAGIGVAIPSFRLMGVALNRHPAQIEDVAEAFAWVRQHAAEFGGDPSRIFVAGHSSGGHLVSLLALDEKYLRHHNLDARAIRGVLSISGVYDVNPMMAFHSRESRKLASPIHHVHPGAPRFLLAYCQWDFVSLPSQARRFAGRLLRAGVDAKLLRIPGDNHVSEILNITKDHGPLIDAVIEFVQE